MTDVDKLASRRLDQTMETSVRLILENSARELSSVSDRCMALQWSMSGLLEHANHPDLSTELHLLQDIDRIQQELKDISTLLATVAPTTSDLMAEAAALSESIKLDSLRARIVPASPEESQGSDFPGSETTEVTWF
ncbi:MAG TPA: hypothetical protein ENK45_00845 [Aliiroseovarius sp.]|nr:hypothetical protein [Aliiroseovarius sp.]